MKHLSIILCLAFALGIATSVQAQRPGRGQGQGVSASAQTVDASQVPAEVTSAFATNFSGVTATKWVKKTVNDKETYTAHFPKDGLAAKARFWNTGSYRWMSIHHPANKVPAALKDAAVAANPGFVVSWAKKIYVAPKSFTYFKVRMKKAGTVLTTYMDENLQPISKQSVNQISSEAEADTEGDTE